MDHSCCPNCGAPVIDFGIYACGRCAGCAVEDDCRGCTGDLDHDLWDEAQERTEQTREDLRAAGEDWAGCRGTFGKGICENDVALDAHRVQGARKGPNTYAGTFGPLRAIHGVLDAFTGVFR